MLLVENVDEALAWYGEVFGAELHASLPQTPPFEWVSLLLDDVEIMFGQKRAAQKWYSDKVTISETPANFIACIYVEDVNSLYEQIKDKAAVIVEPTDQLYAIREFAIQDPLGFIWVFGQIHQGASAQKAESSWFNGTRHRRKNEQDNCAHKDGALRSSPKTAAVHTNAQRPSCLILFVNGTDEAMEKARAKVPDAVFTTSAELGSVLARVPRSKGSV